MNGNWKSWIGIGVLLCLGSAAGEAIARDRWPVEKAKQWHDRQPWLVGCNYIPSTAINQLEMWQKETFDPATIDRELVGRKIWVLIAFASSCITCYGNKTAKDFSTASINSWPLPISTVLVSCWYRSMQFGIHCRSWANNPIRDRTFTIPDGFNHLGGNTQGSRQT